MNENPQLRATTKKSAIADGPKIDSLSRWSRIDMIISLDRPREMPIYSQVTWDVCTRGFELARSARERQWLDICGSEVGTPGTRSSPEGLAHLKRGWRPCSTTT